ncbi:DDE Tnp4 domain-containing protein [Abeliophyllum distichum]|uniref:DDE Tnp4 domain-containing protein n=1 Tax=Abeliophyllum distichum TaxID=126358 RepID=A0ABD1TCQ6_9LAMI
MVIQAIVIYDGIRRRARHLPRAPHRNWEIERQMTLTRMFGTSDRICRDLLRMKIGPFQRLCAFLRTFGLVDSKSVRVEEQMAIFLNTVGHDQRNRAGSFTFFRSGQTVSYYFHRVLHACLGLFREVVTNATIHNSPYDKDNVKPWYSYFQDAVGAIDGTHIDAYVPVEDQARYRNRKQGKPDFGKWRTKLCRRYDDMECIFGNDTATGDRAVSGFDTFSPMLVDESVNEHDTPTEETDPSPIPTRKRHAAEGNTSGRRKRTKSYEDSDRSLALIAESSKKLLKLYTCRPH